MRGAELRVEAARRPLSRLLGTPDLHTQPCGHFGGEIVSGGPSSGGGGRADLALLLLLVGTLFVLAHAVVSSYMVSDGSVPASAADNWGRNLPSAAERGVRPSFSGGSLIVAIPAHLTPP